MVPDRLCYVCCLGDYFKILIINKAYIQYRRLSHKRVYKGILGYTALFAAHYARRCFTRVRLLLRLAVLSSKEVILLFGLVYLLVIKP